MRTVSKLLILITALAFWGCSESTGPTADGETGGTWAEGTLDPGAGTFLLKTIDLALPGDGRVVPVDLIGSNLTIDPGSERVTIDVALHNRWSEALYAPAALWLRDFSPEIVSPIDADWIIQPPMPPGDGFADWMEFGWDYSGFLGGDDVLEPGETSQARTLVFHDPSLAPFAFAARAEFGMIPDLPILAGRCFFDENHDGVPQEDERGHSAGAVTVTGPDSLMISVRPDDWGRWSTPVQAAGLYTLRYQFMYQMPMDPPFTTPNPLEVLLTPGPDGRPQSFLEANFGIGGFWPPDFGQPIGFTDTPLDSLHFGWWSLLEAHVERLSSLVLHVGYSGCEPDQRFSLWTDGAFMESLPVQVNAVLVLEEMQDCDAAFMDERRFDLRPLYERFLSAYGPGELVLNLMGPDGQVFTIELPVYPPDGVAD